MSKNKLLQYPFNIAKLIEESVHNELIRLLEQDLDLGSIEDPEGDSKEAEETTLEEPQEGAEEDTEDTESNESTDENEEPEEDTKEAEDEEPSDPIEKIMKDLSDSLNSTNNPQDVLNLAKQSIQTHFGQYSDIDPLISKLQSSSNPILKNVGQRLSMFVKGQ